jgi:hypothetical protein
MPVCHRCGTMQASAELRGTPKGHVCLDKPLCKRRQATVAPRPRKDGNR